MIVNCPNSCEVCHLLNPKVRCSRDFLNISSTPALSPGDMNRMFERIVNTLTPLYNINVISRDPWVLTFENFVTDEEAETIVRLQQKWERSTDTGSMNEYGEVGRILSNGRTSSNSWCTRDCERHPRVDDVLRRIESTVGIPRSHYESLQVLQYDKGQKYVVHHDYGADDLQKPCGPRILTFFLYLSDVEEGGETAFPLLNIAGTISPQSLMPRQ